MLLNLELYNSEIGSFERPWIVACHPAAFDSLERFSVAFTANGKGQAEISRLPKTREIYLFSAYILPVSHGYGASTKNREIS